METCQQQNQNIKSARRKSIRYDSNRQRLFRYSVQNADRYLDQMIQSVKYGEDRNKQWKKQKELEPISQQGHQELLVKFRSKTCALKKGENRKCGLQKKQRNMEQKQRTVSVCKRKLNRGQNKCIPLEDKISNKTDQETNIDKVEILRYIKQRELSNILTQTVENINRNINKNINIFRTKIESKQNKQKMKGMTLNNNYREFRKIYACSYSGKSIPIMCCSGNNSVSGGMNNGGMNSCNNGYNQSVNGDKDQVDFQVLDQEKVLFGPFCQGEDVNQICKNQKVIPTSTKIIYPAFTNYKNLELFSVENSEFLSNFNKIKFDPRIKEQRQQQLKQNQQGYNCEDHIISLIDADIVQKQASQVKKNVKIDNNRNSKMVQYNPILQQYVNDEGHKMKLAKRRVTFRHLRS